MIIKVTIPSPATIPTIRKIVAGTRAFVAVVGSSPSVIVFPCKSRKKYILAIIIATDNKKACSY